MATQIAEHTDTKLETELDVDDIDGFFGGGGGEHDCEWDEGICDKTATHYILSYCDNPDCKARHMRYYCERHYALTLARILHHLPDCDRYKPGMSAEERREQTLLHIAAWGSISSAS